jgi:hypothetical protein
MRQRENADDHVARFAKGRQVDAWFILTNLCALGDLVAKSLSLLLIMTAH